MAKGNANIEDIILDLLSFKVLITPFLIIIIYLLGILFITYIVFLSNQNLSFMGSLASDNTILIFAEITEFIILNIIWRTICEAWIILFNINGNLEKVKYLLGFHEARHKPSKDVIEEDEEDNKHWKKV